MSPHKLEILLRVVRAGLISMTRWSRSTATASRGSARPAPLTSSRAPLSPFLSNRANTPLPLRASVSLPTPYPPPRRRVGAVKAALDATLLRANRGLLLNAGVEVAIVGRPNVGKSSLLNALAGSEKAIVSPQAGTTRDVVEARVSISGVPTKLLDTAGIRADAEDLVEKIGIERSRTAATAASIVVQVMDAGEGWTEGDGAVFEATVARKQQGFSQTALLVRNKVDAPERPGAAPLPAAVGAAFSEVVGTSAVRGDGLRELEEALARAMGAGGGDAEGELWGANERQIGALSEASSCVRPLSPARSGLSALAPRARSARQRLSPASSRAPSSA